MLHRATFLHERDVTGVVEGYDPDASIILKAFECLPENSKQILLAKNQIKSYSEELLSNSKPFWESFYSKLVSEPEQFRKDKYGKAAEILLAAFFSEKAYSFPFLFASQHFLEELNQKYEYIFSLDFIPEIYSTLIKWYVSRMVETARFVLHIVYTKSNLKYSEWCDFFRRSETCELVWNDICVEFPVLVRWLAAIDNNVKTSLFEMFNRLETDRESISKLFSISESSSLTRIIPNLSDPHRNGRTVMRLVFDDINSIIYKPKPLNIEAEFNKFSTNNLKELGIIGLKVLLRNDYGWVEDAGDGFDQENIFHNPESIGQAAACFWMLNATDLHFENVRADPKGVYALDVETLLAASIVSNHYECEPSWKDHSINTTLLFNSSVGASGKLLNISGFNPSQNFSLPDSQVRFDVVNAEIKMSVEPSREVKSSSDYTPAIQQNYSVINKIIDSFKVTTNSEGRSKIEKLVTSFSDDSFLRFVFRDTYFYTRLLDRMRQPRFLRDGAFLSLDLLLLHSGVPNESVIAEKFHELVDDEIYQLIQGDIPYFCYRANGVDLYTARGIISDFFETNGKKHALDKIHEIEESDVNEQSALITIALGGDHNSINKISGQPINFHSVNKNQTPEHQLLLPIKELSENIVGSAFCPSKTPARWLSLFGDVSGRELLVDVGDKGFFGGSWGIILAVQSAENALSPYLDTKMLTGFLDSQADLWSKCIKQMLSEKTKNVPALIGFSGLGGEIFAQSLLISLNRNRWNFLNNYLSEALEGIENTINNDRWLDVIGGTAGLIIGCEQLLKIDVSPAFATKIIRIQQTATNHLIEKATDSGNGLCWKIPREKNPLLGFAHGWAGIVVAISRLRNRELTKEYKKTIELYLKKAAKYPQTLFYTNKIWGDYRKESLGSESLNRSWCHGIPGFLRGMLEIQDHCSEEIHSEINFMLEKVKVLASFYGLFF